VYFGINGIPLNKSKLSIPHTTPAKTENERKRGAKNDSKNRASKGPVKRPVKNKAFLKRESVRDAAINAASVPAMPQRIIQSFALNTDSCPVALHKISFSMVLLRACIALEMLLIAAA
jgi:hypothetical protein